MTTEQAQDILKEVVSDGADGDRLYISVSDEHLRIEIPNLDKRKSPIYKYVMIKDVVRLLKDAKRI